jgi:membrane protein implicated in regulation of membrane protease activity
MNSSIVFWLIIGALTLAIDAAGGLLFFVCLTVGAITAGIAALLNYPIIIQVTTFFIVSILFILIGYPLMKKPNKSLKEYNALTEQGYIGREITIDEEVVDRAVININGIYWNIKNEGDFIKKGDKVRITSIEGNKIVIRKI